MRKFPFWLEGSARVGYKIVDRLHGEGNDVYNLAKRNNKTKRRRRQMVGGKR